MSSDTVSCVPSGLANFLTQVGNNCMRQRQYGIAREAYSRAVEACDSSEEARINLGRIATREGRYQEAEQHFDQVLRESSDNDAALLGQAIVMLQQHRYDEATRFAERAIRAGQAVGRLDARSYSVLAAVCRANGDYEREQRAIDEGLAVLPDAGELRQVRAASNLLHRRWIEGWKDHQHRSSRLRLLDRFDELEEWDGSSTCIRDKRDVIADTLVIFGEGAADHHLLFSRYIPEVLKWNPAQRVVFYTRPELARFFKNLGVSIVTSEQEVARVVASGDRCRWVGLESLPHLLGLAEPIKPMRQRVSREDVERFTTLIGSQSALRIGLYWTSVAARDTTISFTDIETLFEVPGCSFYSLQRMRECEDKRVLDLASHCHDLADLAAAISNLDLVITTDTHVAHLAGALCKPTWVLCSRASSWIWGCDRDDVQWYPTMRLFRQTRASGWNNVIERVSEVLTKAATLQKRAAFDVNSRPNTPAQASALIKQQCRYAEMTFHRTDHWVGRSLDLYGEWSEGEVELFRKIVKPGDVVIEAGAHVGALTIPLAQIVAGTGRVHAFEPQRDNFNCLVQNVRPLHNVTVWPKALASKPYGISYSTVDLDKVCNLGSTELCARCGGVAPESDVTTTIDELFPLASVAFIKADVEGMELEILEGAVATIERCRPILYVEDDREQNSAALHTWLTSRGYRLYRHTPPLYNPENWRGSRVNVFGRTVSINLLCIPNSSYELKSVTDLLQRVRA